MVQIIVRKRRKGSVFPICDETIKEPSKHRKGEDSIYYEGYCEAWIHRRCAGLSVTNFAALSDSGEDHTYFCLYCELHAQKAEMENLMSTITQLQTTLSELKRKLDSLRQTALQTSKPQALLLSNTSSKGTNSVQSASDAEKKFNIVVYIWNSIMSTKY